MKVWYIIPEYNIRTCSRQVGTVLLSSSMRICNPTPRAETILRIPWSLCIAAHNFHLLGLHLALIVEFEINVLDKESPDVIAKPIRVQVALRRRISDQHHVKAMGQSFSAAGYLESQTGFDLIRQHLRHALVVGEDDFHGELRFNVAAMNQLIERIDQCES